MPLGHRPLIAIVVAGALLWFWLTLPPSRLVLDESCAPQDIPSILSAWIYGGEFWTKQQAAVSDELAALQEIRDQAKGGIGRPSDITPIERRMRRLTEQQMAELAAGQEEAWRNEVLWLGRCDASVKAHLARSPN